MWALVAMLITFAVKIPAVPVHTWLPAAHVQAPTVGSVILAGIMLKFGTYGLIRFALQMTPDAFREAGVAVLIFGVVGRSMGLLPRWLRPISNAWLPIPRLTTWGT